MVEEIAHTNEGFSRNSRRRGGHHNSPTVQIEKEVAHWLSHHKLLT